MSINSERLGAADAEQFADLQRQLTDLLNQNRWTNTTFSPAERIDCSFTLNLLTASDAGEYTAELYITAQRPVYNASYVTSLVVFRDKELNFTYQPYDPIEYNPADLQSNLVTTVAFYAYFILAMNFDSFAPLGGDIVKDQLRQIANVAQQKQDWTGWTPFASDANRYTLAETFNSPAQEPFRKLWYQYHRKGLDELVGNVRRGYTNILEALPLLEESWKAELTSPLLQIFAQTKLEELTKVVEEAPADKKNEAYKILHKVFPTDEQKYQALKQ